MSKAEPPSIWMRPEPGDRKPRFSREKIAQAALDIADSAGFEAVSMREVASRLGAGTMTLYHYVRTKDDLVALMDDALLAEVLVPDAELPEGWRAQLSAIALRTRAVYERHPWALLAMRGARPGPNGLRHFEQCLAALAETRLDKQAKLELLGVIDDLVFGHALRAAERASFEGAGAAEQSHMQFTRRQLATGQFPHMAALFGQADMREAGAQLSAFIGADRRFERGLQALLDAAERSMRGARAPVARKALGAAKRGSAKRRRKRS
jgi:AcrR family transcriptional regulator